MLNIYNQYFAKDKALRHYTQHLLLALLGFVLFSFYLGAFSFSSLILFLIFSFVIDLDNFLCLFIFRRRYAQFYAEIISALKKRNFKLVAEIATKNHKVLNNLLLHNIIGYLLVSISLGLSMLLGMNILVTIFSAIFIHMTFDVLDDIKQLGHINNWLWPINKFKRKK